MSQLDEDIRAADELGFSSYGKYIAWKYENSTPIVSPTKKKRTHHRTRKFTDAEAFLLWQQGLTDSEIGHILNVSRAYIQRWRDQLELPSTARLPVDTKKYRLSKMEDGTPIVINDEL